MGSLSGGHAGTFSCSLASCMDEVSGAAVLWRHAVRWVTCVALGVHGGVPPGTGPQETDGGNPVLRCPDPESVASTLGTACTPVNGASKKGIVGQICPLIRCPLVPIFHSLQSL